MSSSLLVLGDLKGGKLRVENRPALDRWIKAQPDGARFRAMFELTDATKRGSLERFYRRILLPQAAEHLGYDVPAMECAFYGAITGITLGPSSVRIQVEQMSDHNLSCFVQDAVRIAAEQGCVLTERP